MSLESGCLKKKLYITYEDADRARKYSSKKTKTGLRVYACQYCKGFHLTHKPYNSFKAVHIVW